ncbi:uncharacterized protein LOC111368283 [Olea europaea var. sylvestris]|uniref:uncharacterized protein LOC111368283 n=1 Tax=Olea europaea var. sylvestris TaxID=158386 RepID=UPI000C1D689D|nr:uncharacterized protein LOC111368283 [Olea europaea var. sylvestris]
MATILKATTTVKARPLKPGSGGAKEVRGRVECLSKDSTPKASKEGAPQSSSRKFGTSVTHEAKSIGEPKLLASASKAIKIEMVREAEAQEEAARRAAEAAEDETAKQKPLREKGKSPSFLAGREETLAPALLHASSCDATDLTRALVSQSIRTFGLALECREALSDFQTRTQSSEEKTASLTEELKAAKAEAEEVRAQKLEELAKLESALAQIEALKKEVHESRCEVAFLTKKVEVSNEHQKVTAEALEKANLSLVGAQEANRFLETQLKWYVDDASHAREEAQQIEALKKEVHESQCEVASLTKKANRFLETQLKWYVDDASHAREEAQQAREEAVQEYVANFHNTEEYKSFSAYWRNFAYAEVMERAEELYPNLDLTQLGSEFVDEVPHTLSEEVQGNDAAEVEETNADAQTAQALSTEAPPPSTQA